MGNKGKNNKIRNVATSKQTGGGGFVFEDKVTAWFIGHFLSDKNPFLNEIGKIKKIDFQVRSEGWLFDDLVLTTEDNNITRKIALSCKSNVQINTTGPNAELLRDIWNQYLGVNSNVFNKKTDYLCIVNSQLPKIISKDINTLIKFSRDHEAETLHQRINKNDKAFSLSLKKIYKGFYCPTDLADSYKVDESETINVLSKLLLIEFDFENAISYNENQIIDLCKDCLSDTDGNIEQQLYKNLCSFRGELAPLSGFLDYQKLIDKLKNHFHLKGFVNHNNDWVKIISVSNSKIDSIPDKIGNKVSLSNSKQLNNLEQLIMTNKVVFILGKSGYGKSVLAKKYIKEKLTDKDKYIWIDSQCLQFGNLETYFSLQNSLSDIFNKVQQSNCYLFIDGIDRFFKDSELSLLYSILTIANDQSTSWKIILTCQTDDYNDVLERLYRINISLDSADFKVSMNISDDISELTDSFPGLTELFKHRHLKPILNNLKYLDLLAYNLTKKPTISESDFKGESTIIDWIWKKEIESIGSSSSRFIQDFSEKQAEKLSASIPVSEFSISEVAPLDKLKENKIFIENEDKLYLVHDLFGDWARYKLIRANNDNIKQFLLSKELFSPLWCKAIRLYGIYLLDKNSDASDWIKLFNELRNTEPNEKIIQDLLLESIIYSSSPYEHLITVWEFLKKNEGELLKRFLDQFLIKATLPNQSVLKLAKEIGGYTIAQAASYYRNPNAIYWVDVLKFIHLNKLDFISLSRKKIAIITQMWLEYTPVNFPYREECSEIALENAKEMFDFKFNGGYVRDDDDKDIYKSMLLSVNEFPKEVIDLSLKLCKRIKIEREVKKKDENSLATRQITSIFSQAKIRDAIQWADGPYEDVDVAFEEICINDNAIHPIIDSFPESAKEILLALFIEAPKEISFGYDSHYNLDINEPHNWFPPFYTRGPFLYFLNHQPKVGLEFIITLVNFATQQWTNEYIHKGIDIPKTTINYNNKSIDYIGDERLYFWYRDATGAPDSIVSALMALEKFLLVQIDSQKSITDYISFILNEGTSVAYLGVLNSIGKYKPDFYLNELKVMLQNYDFYEWEKSLGYGAQNIEGHQMIGSNFLGKKTWNLAKEWNEMPHRKMSLQKVTLPLLVNKQHDLKDYYKSIIEIWKDNLNKIESEGYTNTHLNNLIHFYNIDNYEIVKYDNVNYYQYKEPEEVTIKYKEAREYLSSDNDLFTFPFQCFQELEQGKMYSLEDCEKLWDKIQTYSKLKDEDPYSHISGKHEAVLAGCALLVFNKKMWIEKYSVRLQWITEYLDVVILNYSLKRSEISQVEMGYSWLASAAKILAILWADDLSNKNLRKQIGSLLFKSTYDSVQILFSSLSKYLKWSDSNFIQIQNLVVLWSLALDKDVRISYLKSFNGKVEKELEKFCLNKYGDSILTDFINNKIDTTLIDWSKQRPIIRKKKRRHWENNLDSIQANEPGIDLKMLNHAFATLPTLDNVEGIEREYAIIFWKRIVDQIVFELGDIVENSEKRDDYPHQFHIWGLQRISKLITELRTTDSLLAQDFWKPIFNYGYLACNWIDIFCDDFFRHNIEKKETHSVFFEEWNKMIDFAYDCKTWNSKAHYNRREIWESLMGLRSNILNYWANEDYYDFFKKVAVEDMKWARKNSFNQDVIYKVILILKTKPGINSLKEGLEIINRYLNLRKFSDKIDTPEGFVRVGFSYEDVLAQMTSHLWENYKEKINNDAEILMNFKEIVLFLVANQNTIGLELQNRIIS